MAIRTNYSFNEFFNLIKDKINEKAKKPSFWGEGSISRAFVQSFAYLAEFIQTQINIAWMSFRVSTAKGIHLDLRVADFGLNRKLATYNIVRQMFVGEVGRTVDIVIPQGTLFQTEPNELGNILEYELLADVTLLSSQTMAEGLVRCTTIGSQGNIDANKITVIPSPISGIASTYNIEDSSNGTDLETDDELRKRVAEFLLGLQNGNEASIKSACYSVEGITYVDVKENDPTIGNFTAYVSTDSGIVDTVLINLVRDAIERVRAFCITYSVSIPIISNITIELDIELISSTYSQNEYINQLKALLFDYINKIRKNEVTQAEIITLLMKQSNVTNVKNVLINGLDADLELASFNVAKLDSINDITFNVTNV